MNPCTSASEYKLNISEVIVLKVTYFIGKDIKKIWCHIQINPAFKNECWVVTYRRCFKHLKGFSLSWCVVALRPHLNQWHQSRCFINLRGAEHLLWHLCSRCDQDQQDSVCFCRRVYCSSKFHEPNNNATQIWTENGERTLIDIQSF